MISQDPNGAPYASTFSAPSIDQVVASRWAAPTRFRSLELGISRRVVSGEGIVAALPSRTTVPTTQIRPSIRAARGVSIDRSAPVIAAGAQAVVDPRFALRRSVLDAVRQDAKTRCACARKSSDRLRIDQH